MASNKDTFEEEVQEPEFERTRYKEKRPITSEEEIEPRKKKKKEKKNQIEESELKKIFKDELVFDNSDFDVEKATSDYIKSLKEREKRTPKGTLEKLVAYANDDEHKGLSVSSLIELARQDAKEENEKRRSKKKIDAINVKD